jgi:mono/diheme cytochrome c family protein
MQNRTHEDLGHVLNKAGATLCFLLLLGTAAPSREVPPPRPGNPDRGLVLFNAYCLGCHGIEGKGDGPMAARLYRDFHVLPIDLTDLAWQKSLNDSALRAIIRGGGRRPHRPSYMPAWGMTINKSQVEDLTAFIRDLKILIPGQPPKASVLDIQERLELGRTLYSINCATCHGRKGEGDGPLVEAADNLGALNHVPPNFNAPGFFRDRTDRELEKNAESGALHAHMNFDVDGHAWWHEPMSEKELKCLVFFLRAQGLVNSSLPNRRRLTDRP